MCSLKIIDVKFDFPAVDNSLSWPPFSSFAKGDLVRYSLKTLKVPEADHSIYQLLITHFEFTIPIIVFGKYNNYSFMHSTHNSGIPATRIVNPKSFIKVKR